MIGILLQIERKIKLIDNWSNKTDTLRHRIQRRVDPVKGQWTDIHRHHYVIGILSQMIT